MTFTDAVDAAHHGRNVLVRHDVGETVGLAVGLDLTNSPCLVVAVGGRDVIVPIDRCDPVAEGGAA